MRSGACRRFAARDEMRPVAAGEAFEPNLSALVERKPVGAGQLIADCIADEDFVSSGCVGDPGRHDDVGAEEIVVIAHDLAGVHAHSQREGNTDRFGGLEFRRQRHRRTDCPFRGAKGGHETVALRLHDLAAIAADSAGGDLVVGPDDPHPLRTHSSSPSRRLSTVDPSMSENTSDTVPSGPTNESIDVRLLPIDFTNAVRGCSRRGTSSPAASTTAVPTSGFPRRARITPTISRIAHANRTSANAPIVMTSSVP